MEYSIGLTFVTKLINVGVGIKAQKCKLRRQIFCENLSNKRLGVVILKILSYNFLTFNICLWKDTSNYARRNRIDFYQI